MGLLLILLLGVEFCSTLLQLIVCSIFWSQLDLQVLPCSQYTSTYDYQPPCQVISNTTKSFTDQCYLWELLDSPSDHTACVVLAYYASLTTFAGVNLMFTAIRWPILCRLCIGGGLSRVAVELFLWTGVPVTAVHLISLVLSSLRIRHIRPVVWPMCLTILSVSMP